MEQKNFGGSSLSAWHTAVRARSAKACLVAGSICTEAQIARETAEILRDDVREHIEQTKAALEVIRTRMSLLNLALLKL